ncbi:hypothetical protein QOT17_024400 [Balamuthia mandrillaris]
MARTANLLLAFLLFCTALWACNAGQQQRRQEPLQVGLFADPDLTNQEVEPHIDGGEDRGSGSMLALLLEELGHNVTTIEDIGSPAKVWTNVLSSVSVFVFPEIDPRVALRRDHVPFFPVGLKNGLDSFVNQGGVVVWASAMELFNHTWQTSWQAPTLHVLGANDFNKTEEAVGTPFEDGPKFVESLSDVQAPANWEGEGVVCYYAFGPEGTCAILSIAQGEGYYVYLAWDYNSFAKAEADGAIDFRDLRSKRSLITPSWEKVFGIAVEGFVPTEEEESSTAEDGESSDSSQEGSNSASSDGSGAAQLRGFFF